MIKIKCPVCKNLASVKTIEKNKRCNNCNAQAALSKMAEHEFLLNKYNSTEVSSLIKEFDVFLKRAPYSYVFKYRTMVDFQKIIQLISKDFEKKTEESKLREMLLEVSAYKLPKILEIIKIFLFAKKMLQFNINNSPWSHRILENWYYYKEDILDYYFEKTRCRDCGKKLPSLISSFCETCLGRRSLREGTTQSNLEKLFETKIASDFFLEFVNFLSKSHLEFKTINDISRLLIHIFKLIEKQRLLIFEKKLFSLVGQPVNGVVSTQWLETAFSSYSELSLAYTKLVSLQGSYGHFCAFLYDQNLISTKMILPTLKVNNGLVTFEKQEKNERKKIEEKILKCPIGFQKLLFYYLEIKAQKIHVLEKKNAVKTLKWSSTVTLFGRFFHCINWAQENYSVESWNEVTQDIMNTYLLKFEKIQYREIEKRALFNLLEFGKKNKFLFVNPILPFTARSHDINEKPFLQKDHVLLQRAIEIASINNATDSLIVSLCYFHVLTPKQIRNIEISDISVERKAIVIPNRPPVYLDDFEVELLINHLKITDDMRSNFNISYLFFNIIRSMPVQVSSVWLLKHTKKVCNHTPHTIRRAALQYCAEMFGPEFLHDCLGLSLTHAARFGDMDDWVIEETISELKE